jgi:hypothetical protein
MQIPAGRVSDRVDRRYVLAGLGAIASASGLAIVVIRPEDVGILFGLIALYGAMSYTLYSIIVAHANDFAAKRPVRDRLQRFAAALRRRHHHRSVDQRRDDGLRPLSAVRRDCSLPISRSPATQYSAAACVPAVPDAEKETFASTPSARVRQRPESINLDPRATASEE